MPGPPQVAGLIGLYLGDEFSLGYYQHGLVVEICRRSNPSTLERLRSLVFGASMPVDEIDPVAYEVLGEGYELWDYEGRPQGAAAARSGSLPARRPQLRGRF